MKSELKPVGVNIVFLFLLFFLEPSSTFAQLNFDSPFVLDSSCNAEDRKILTRDFFVESDQKFRIFFKNMMSEFNFSEGASVRSHSDAYLYFTSQSNKIPIHCKNKGNSRWVGEADLLAHKITLVRGKEMGFNQMVLFHEMYHFLAGGHNKGYVDFTVFCTASAFGEDNYFGGYTPDDKTLSQFKRWCASGGTYELIHDQSYSDFIRSIGGQLYDNYTSSLEAYYNEIKNDNNEESTLAKDWLDFNTAFAKSNLVFYHYLAKNLKNRPESNKFVETFILPNREFIYDKVALETSQSQKTEYFHYFFDLLLNSQINENNLKTLYLSYLRFECTISPSFWQLSIPEFSIVHDDPFHPLKVVALSTWGESVLGVFSKQNRVLNIPSTIDTIRIDILSPDINPPRVLRSFTAYRRDFLVH